MLQSGLRAPLRWGYTLLGGLMVLLGIIGAFLPVMPTTVFLLMALACFSKSSPRFEQWLLQHPRFGASLRAWREHRVVPPRAKISACLGMSIGLLILAATPAPWWVVVSVAVMELIVAVYLLRRPSFAREPAHEPALLPETTAPQGFKRSLAISLLLHLGLFSYFLTSWTSPPVLPAHESEQLEITLLQAAAPSVPLAQTEARQISRASTKSAPAPKPSLQPAPPVKPAAPVAPITPPIMTLPQSTLSAGAAKPEAATKPAAATEEGPVSKTASVSAAPAAAPAQQGASGGSHSWEGKILARLERFRRYPNSARMRGDEGVAYLRIRINREGQLLSSKLERSSGFASLDRAAAEAAERAAPLPRIPAERPDEIELLVPFEFSIHK